MLTLLVNCPKYSWILAGFGLLLSIHGPVQAADKPSVAATPFAVAQIRFESNVTDGDVEVVFEVKGGKDGLSSLAVVSPDGRTVIDFKATDASTLGIRQFQFESPEPKDNERLKSAYPAGVYTFTGATAAGEKLYSQYRLKHELPATAMLLRPEDRTRGISVDKADITWAPIKHLKGVIVEIKQSESGASITSELPGTATSFAVPPGFLVPDTEYELSIGTVSEYGNISFVETTFTTVKQK